MSRSSSAAVRNPIASDPEVARLIAAATPEARRLVANLMRVLSRKWRVTAEHSWRKHKAPVAAYWKANAVNARHLGIAVRTNEAPERFERRLAVALRDVLEVMRENLGAEGFAEFAGTSEHGPEVCNDRIVRALAALELADAMVRA